MYCLVCEVEKEGLIFVCFDDFDCFVCVVVGEVFFGFEVLVIVE